MKRMKNKKLPKSKLNKTWNLTNRLKQSHKVETKESLLDNNKEESLNISIRKEVNPGKIRANIREVNLSIEIKEATSTINLEVRRTLEEIVKVDTVKADTVKEVTKETETEDIGEVAEVAEEAEEDSAVETKVSEVEMEEAEAIATINLKENDRS